MMGPGLWAAERPPALSQWALAPHWRSAAQGRNPGGTRGVAPAPWACSWSPRSAR